MLSTTPAPSFAITAPRPTAVTPCVSPSHSALLPCSGFIAMRTLASPPRLVKKHMLTASGRPHLLLPVLEQQRPGPRVLPPDDADGTSFLELAVLGCARLACARTADFLSLYSSSARKLSPSASRTTPATRSRRASARPPSRPTAVPSTRPTTPPPRTAPPRALRPLLPARLPRARRRLPLLRPRPALRMALCPQLWRTLALVRPLLPSVCLLIFCKGRVAIQRPAGDQPNRTPASDVVVP